MPPAMTVTGPVEADALGHVLPHEHVFINLLAEYRAEGLLNDATRMAEELTAFREVGGGTLVELTPAELTAGAAPDPLGLYRKVPEPAPGPPGSRAAANVHELRALATETGVNIIMGTGHYRDPYLDKAWFDRTSVDEIADGIVRELTDGVAGTGVRAGIIGEIGADRWYVSAAEERSFRAAARAHQRTGVPITTHAARWPVGTAQLDILVSEGVDPLRVIIGHCDGVNIPEYHRDLARRGAYVQYDLIRGADAWETASRVRMVVGMVRDGLIDHVLLSHDVCGVKQLKTAGGWGYTFIRTRFTELLAEAGLDAGEIDQIVVDNPRRALTAA
jgi:phosphotriesterase-related protein